MSKEISRREFLENVGMGAAAGTSMLLLKDVTNALPEKNVLPSRTLGRTGAKVSFSNRVFPDHGAVVHMVWPRDRFETSETEAETAF